MSHSHWFGRLRGTGSSVSEKKDKIYFSHHPISQVTRPSPFSSIFQKYKYLVRNQQIKQTISIQFDWNIWDLLLRWSTLTGLVILGSRTEISLSIRQNCCLNLCNRNVPFHWARGISKISDKNFCWMESGPYYLNTQIFCENVCSMGFCQLLENKSDTTFAVFMPVLTRW